MRVTITCDGCSRTHRVRKHAAGEPFACKGCGNMLTVEAPTPNDCDLNLQPTSPGTTLETTSEGWQLTMSMLSYRGVFYCLIFGLCAVLSLMKVVESLDSTNANHGVWGVPQAILSILSIVLAYFAAIWIWGKIVIAVEKTQGTIFTGIGVIGLSRRFDWSKVTRIVDERVPTSGAGRDFEIVLYGPTQIRFGATLPKGCKCEVLALLQKLLKQEKRGDRPFTIR